MGRCRGSGDRRGAALKRIIAQHIDNSGHLFHRINRPIGDNVRLRVHGKKHILTDTQGLFIRGAKG